MKKCNVKAFNCLPYPILQKKKNLKLLKNKYNLMLCQSRLHTASETFICHKKIGSGLIFGIFASVACILIGKDEEYEKMEKRMRTVSD